MILVIAALIFVAVAIAVAVILLLPGRKSEAARKRLEELTAVRVTRAEDEDIGIRSEAAEVGTWSFLGKIASVFSVFMKKEHGAYSELRLSLMQAGYYGEHSVRTYIGLRILLALIFFFGGFAIVFLARGRTPQQFLVLLLMLMPLAGYLVPTFVLAWRTRVRQDQIGSGLPDALDFLVVCIEAGLGLNSALVRVGRELRIKNRALGEELTFVNQEMRTGIPREEALRHLAERNLVEDLNIVVASLILADKLGTSIADTLRAQSDSLRTRVRQRAEERAARSGIRLLFPLVFMVLPTLFIVILGPAFIMGLRALRAMVEH